MFVLDAKTLEAFLRAAHNRTVVIRPSDEVQARAFYNEHGTRSIPARSFFYSVFTRNNLRRGVAAAIRYNALGAFGKLLRDEVVLKINRAYQWARPVSKQTARRKGHNKPLVSSTKLIRNIEWYLE